MINLENFNENFKYYRNSVNGLLNAGPVWDFDWAWKNIDECYFGVTNGSGWAYKVLECNVWPTPTGWMPRLMTDPAFVSELKQRYSALRKTTLSNEYLMHYVDSVNTVIADAQVRHFKKWPILGQNVGSPESDYIPTTFAGESTKFKNWITTRLLWLDKQLLVPLSDGPEIPSAELSCRLFPNPVHDILNINANLPVESVRIFNYAGMLVQSADNIKAYSHQLDVSSLKPGIYVVKVTLQDSRIVSVKQIID